MNFQGMDMFKFYSDLRENLGGKLTLLIVGEGYTLPRATNLSLAEQVMFAQQLEPHFVGSETVHFLDARSILTHIDIL